MNRKILLAILLVIVVFASAPLLISATTQESQILSAIAGLSSQLSNIETHIMDKLASIEQRLAALESTVGGTVKSSIEPLLPLIQATLALVVIAVILSVVNLMLLLRRAPAPGKPKPKEAYDSPHDYVQRRVDRERAVHSANGLLHGILTEMRTSDIFKLAFKALRDRKLRSFLTILGIMIGSAVILALIASSSGLSVGIQAQVEKIGANTLTVSSARQFFGGSSSGTQSYQLSEQDVNTIESFQGVSDVIPYYSQRATISYGSNSIEGELIGVDASALFAMYKGLSLYSGSLPDSYDPSAATVGYSIAFPTGSSDQLALNQMVSITLGGSTSGSLTFLVKGIFSAYGRVLFSDIDETIFISLQSAQILLKTQCFSGLYVMTDTPGDVTSVQQEIESYYGDQVRVMNAGSMLSSVESITSQMTVFLGSIGAVSLFVAAVGITNTMFVSVMERTREIGILKALGYRPKQIMGMFLSEAVLSGIIGGVGGTILGYALSFIIGGALPLSGGFAPPGRTTSSTTLTPVFTPELIAFSLLFPIGIAVLAGLYPAWRASRMNAVVALKYE